MSNFCHFYKDRVPWKGAAFLFILVTTLSFSPFSYGQETLLKNNLPGNHSFPNWLRLNEINRVASLHFMNHFSADGTERWMLEDRSYVAYFNVGDIKGRAFYKINGDFKYVIKTYGPEMLEPELKNRVTEHFDGYKISCVIEISNLDRTAYFFKIVNAENIKTLKYLDGQLTITENLVNGGL